MKSLRRSGNKGGLHDTKERIFQNMYCRKHCLRKFARRKIDGKHHSKHASKITEFGAYFKEKDHYNYMVQIFMIRLQNPEHGRNTSLFAR
jgi:hypothetical protein